MTNLRDILRHDPGAEAERLTGGRMGEDAATGLLGMALHMQHNEVKRTALMAADDTMLCNDLDRYQRILNTNGFELALQDGFKGRDWGKGEPVPDESYFIYARRDGLLLGFDTYQTTRVNGGKVWYNWVPADWNGRWDCTSSGGTKRAVVGTEIIDIWVGDHDCREGLIHNMNRLTENGRLLAPWPVRPSCLWLASFMDWDAYRGCSHDVRVDEIEAITADRLSRCPDWVRDMVGERKA